MALSAGTVSLAVKPDTKNFGSDLHSSIMGDSGIGGIGKGIGGMIVGGIAAVGIGAAVVGFVKSGMGEMMDASAGNAQLAAGIKSTGNAAGVTVDSMNKMASSIQNMSGQTDDSITKSQQLLLTFTNIKNNGPDKIFDQATLASANMAAKMGGDAAGSAVMLGKALNDPTAGIAALTRVGVTFTDGQKASIASMQAMGDTAGAQKIILGELNTEFGGAAEAAGQSLPGMIERGKRAFEDLSQTVAEMLLPVLVPVLGGMVTALQKALPYVQAFAGGVGGAFTGVKDLLIGGNFTEAFRTAFHVEEDSPIVGFLLTVRDTVMKMWDSAKPILEGVGQLFVNLGPILGPLIPQILGIVSSLSPMSLIMDALGPIMPMIVSALTDLGAALGGALAGILPTVVDLVGTLAGVLGGVLADVLPVVVSLIGTLAGVFVSIMPTIVSLAGVLGGALTQILPVIGTLIKALVPIFAALLPPIMQVVGVLIQALGPVLEIVIGIIVMLVQVIVPILIPVIQILGAIIGFVFQAIGNIISFLWTGVIQPVFAFIGGAIDVMGGVFTWLWESIISPAFNAIGAIFQWLWDTIISPVVSFINDAIKTVGDVVGTVFGAIGGIIQGAFDGVVGYVKNIFNNVINMVNLIIDGINSIPGIAAGAEALGIHMPLGHIPALAEGGIVPATPGGRLVRVAEAGQAEAVVPLSKMAGMGGGVQVHVTNKTGVNLADFIDLHITNASERRKINLSTGMQKVAY